GAAGAGGAAGGGALLLGAGGAGGAGWDASAGSMGGFGGTSAAGTAGTSPAGAAGQAGADGADVAPVDTGNDAGACTLLGSEVQVAQFTQPGVGGIAVDGAGTLTWTGEAGNPELGALEFDNLAGGSSRLTHTTSGDF